MKRVLFLAALMFAGGLFAAYDPFDDCADVDVILRVVDERGEPVADANAVVAYQISPEKGEVVKGMTDAQGCYATKGRCNSIVNIEVTKAGFYDSHIRESVAKEPTEKVVATRRWTQVPVQLTVVLKTVRKPIKMTVRSVDFKPYPATNEIVKLDLEMLEWCPPYGRGKHDDLHLVFDGWRNPREWLDFHEHLTVSMPNCVDGFYRQKIDGQSKLRYSYEANTNAVYEKAFEFRHVMKPGGKAESKRLEKDEYLVYRVRTQTNELGQVTHAHYGRIGEKFSQYIGLSIKAWFNPTDNDTNLESEDVPKTRTRGNRRY